MPCAPPEAPLGYGVDHFGTPVLPGMLPCAPFGPQSICAVYGIYGPAVAIGVSCLISPVSATSEETACALFRRRDEAIGAGGVGNELSVLLGSDSISCAGTTSTTSVDSFRDNFLDRWRRRLITKQVIKRITTATAPPAPAAIATTLLLGDVVGCRTALVEAVFVYTIPGRSLSQSANADERM